MDRWIGTAAHVGSTVAPSPSLLQTLWLHLHLAGVIRSHDRRPRNKTSSNKGNVSPAASATVYKTPSNAILAYIIRMYMVCRQKGFSLQPVLFSGMPHWCYIYCCTLCEHSKECYIRHPAFFFLMHCSAVSNAYLVQHKWAVETEETIARLRWISWGTMLVLS